MDTEKLPQTNLSPASPAPEERDWRSLYSVERKRSRILGATTVAASLLAVGAGAWGLTQADSSAGSAGPAQMGGPGSTSQFGAPGSTYQFGGPDGTTGQLAPPGTGQSGTSNGPGASVPGQDLAAELFNSDGSVNTDALQQFLSAMPGGGANLEQFLTMAVQNDLLTSDQADQLLAAAGTGTTDGATTDGGTSNITTSDTEDV